MSRLRIGVVGFLRRQFQEVASRCGGGVELYYLDKTLNRPRFPRRLDRVIVVGKFISHGWQRDVLENFPRDRVHRLVGAVGASSVVRLVESLVLADHH